MKLLLTWTYLCHQVGTDILEEKITAFEDFVQSMDVAAFNKIWKQNISLIKALQQNVALVFFWKSVSLKQSEVSSLSIVDQGISPVRVHVKSPVWWFKKVLMISLKCHVKADHISSEVSAVLSVTSWWQYICWLVRFIFCRRRIRPETEWRGARQKTNLGK